MTRQPSPCPCGSGTRLADCCQPLLDGARQALTAEELMRSRYSAYALGDADYVYRTWHPRTRPADVVLDDGSAWVSLEVVRRDRGGPLDDEGEVEFVARWSGPDGRGALHETSRFTRRTGRWFYLDGDTD